MERWQVTIGPYFVDELAVDPLLRREVGFRVKCPPHDGSPQLARDITQSPFRTLHLNLQSELAWAQPSGVVTEDLRVAGEIYVVVLDLDVPDALARRRRRNRLDGEVAVAGAEAFADLE
jgi:hypothetical protein